MVHGIDIRPDPRAARSGLTARILDLYSRLVCGSVSESCGVTAVKRGKRRLSASSVGVRDNTNCGFHTLQTLMPWLNMFSYVNVCTNCGFHTLQALMPWLNMFSYVNVCNALLCGIVIYSCFVYS